MPPPPRAVSAPYDAHLLDILIAQDRQIVQTASRLAKATHRRNTKEYIGQLLSETEANLAQLENWRSTWFPQVPRLDPKLMSHRVCLHDPQQIDSERACLRCLASEQKAIFKIAEDSESRAENVQLKDFCFSLQAQLDREMDSLNGLALH